MKKYRLYAKPQRAPKWWPREGGKVLWVGVLNGGIGWVVGDGHFMTKDKVEEAERIFREEFGACVHYRRVTG